MDFDSKTKRKIARSYIDTLLRDPNLDLYVDQILNEEGPQFFEPDMIHFYNVNFRRMTSPKESLPEDFQDIISRRPNFMDIFLVRYAPEILVRTYTGFGRYGYQYDQKRVDNTIKIIKADVKDKQSKGEPLFPYEELFVGKLNEENISLLSENDLLKRVK